MGHSKGLALWQTVRPAFRRARGLGRGRVEGQITETSLGVYTYLKRRLPKDPLPCAVTVFPLRVARLAEKFPERKERQRKWFAARKAARKVDEPELRQILSNLDKDPSVLTNAQSA